METAGIYIEHNANGIPAFARIDLSRYGERLRDFFTSAGVKLDKPPYDTQFVAKIKSQENMPGVKVKASDIWS